MIFAFALGINFAFALGINFAFALGFTIFIIIPALSHHISLQRRHLVLKRWFGFNRHFLCRSRSKRRLLLRKRLDLLLPSVEHPCVHRPQTNLSTLLKSLEEHASHIFVRAALPAHRRRAKRSQQSFREAIDGIAPLILHGNQFASSVRKARHAAHRFSFLRHHLVRDPILNRDLPLCRWRRRWAFRMMHAKQMLDVHL